MSEENINIKIKLSNNNVTFNISTANSSTVRELKESCVKESTFSIEEQNMVYRGKILADDKLISDYGVLNDHTIILVLMTCLI